MMTVMEFAAKYATVDDCLDLLRENPMGGRPLLPALR